MQIKQIPQRAMPTCDCNSEISVFVRRYGTGMHYWLSCSACGAIGKQAIPSRVLSKLERDQAVHLETDDTEVEEMVNESESLFGH